VEVAELDHTRDSTIGKLRESEVTTKHNSQQAEAATDDATFGRLGEVFQIHDTQSQTQDISSQDVSVEYISSGSDNDNPTNLARHDSYNANLDLFTHPSLSDINSYQTFLQSLSQKHPSDKEILQLLHARDKNDTVMRIKNDSFEKHDFESLCAEKWVSDQVINGFFNHFIRPRETYLAQLPRLRRKQWGTTNSYFIAGLLQYRTNLQGTYNDDIARRYLKGTDFNELRGILFPWHLHETHWALIVVDFEKKTMSLLDSLWDNDMREPRKIMKAIERYIADRRNLYPGLSREPITQWKRTFNRGGKIPRQPNHADCGIYTCFFADYITLGFNFYGDDHSIGATYRRYILFQLGRYLQHSNH
jgi:Ulp1 family protease